MQTAFARRYRASDSLTIEKNFLAPQKLNDRFVTQATIPEQIAKEDYIAEMCEVGKQARVRYNSAVDAGTVPRYPIEVFVERQKQCHAKMLKKRFVAECLKFLPAYGYQRALEKWHIRDRLNWEVRMYSTDTIGWTTYNYVINRDICIQLDSNFGYGQSSYFLLSLLYKGIEIYPFGKYVRYPYANMRTLIAHTRSYRVEWESWTDALMFVAETANAAVQSPQTFVETFIGDEIGKMMAGLRDELRRQHFPKLSRDIWMTGRSILECQ